MKNFFKRVFATMLGMILAFFLFFLIIAIILQYKSSPMRFSPKNNSVLLLKFNGTMYEDTPPMSPFEKRNPKMSLKNIIEAIKYAKNDPKIKAIKIEFSYFECGWASLEEIRKQLKEFKKTKKQIISFSDFYTNKSYYLASVSNKIFLHPEGMFFWPGIAARYFYYKNLFDRVNIKPIEFHIGEYKDYGEKFIKSQMGQKSREQISEILDHIYDDLILRTSKSRNIIQDKLKNYAKNLEIKVAKDALDHNLVDILGYNDDTEKYLKTYINLKENEDVNYILLDNYYEYKNNKAKKNSKKQIAILIAEGQIMDGKSKYGETIGAKDIIKTIKKLKKDKNVKGVVLRIKSPGGSALASDEIWHELKLLKKEKPLIVSMSDVAASGGYYIASAADLGDIYAYKNTITGSIGVLFLMFNMEGLFKNILGITNSIVSTEPHADLFSASRWGLQRNLSETENNYFQQIIKSHYNGFISKVALARKTTIDQIDTLARGRVWIGIIAKEKNLVDHLGYFDDAIKAVAKKAKLTDYSIFYYPKKRMFIEIVLDTTIEKIKAKLCSFLSIEDYKTITKITSINKLKGPQALMPIGIEIY